MINKIFILLFLLINFNALSAEISLSPAVIEKDRYIPSAISIKGDIDSSDYIKFIREYLNSLSSKFPVEEVWLLKSNGGNLEAAMSIGTAIDKLYLTVRVIDDCYSACAFIALSANYRIFIGEIGLHRPYLDQEYYSGLSAVEAKEKYEIMSQNVRLYLMNHDVPTEVVDKAFSKSSTQVWTIKFHESNEIFGAMKPSFHEWAKSKCPVRQPSDLDSVDVELNCLHKIIRKTQSEAAISLLKSSSE